MSALSLTLRLDCAYASEGDTVHGRGGAVIYVFIGWFSHNLSSFSSNDWTDGTSTTDGGRLVHIFVLRYINDLFLCLIGIFFKSFLVVSSSC